jgi:CarboxypepD_reg-like domain
MNRVFRHLCLTLLVFSIYQPLSSQSFTISGFLTSNETGEVLVGAYVFCPQTGSGAVSNNYGYYAISIPYGTKNILYMSEGYYAKVDTTRIQANKQVDVGLSPMDEDGIQTDPFFNVGVEDEPESSEEESDSSGAPLKVRIRNSYQVNQLITYVLERRPHRKRVC